jgi:hypothetical protein
MPELRLSVEFRRLSPSEEHLDAAEWLEAATVGLSGGLDHTLDDFGAERLTV